MRRKQEGQVLLIFALVATFLVGVIALAIDYGFTVNQHRNLQNFSDAAAAAGAAQLPGTVHLSDQTNARTVAFQYLRNNLLSGRTSAGLSTATGFTCNAATPTPAPVDFTKDIDNCTLPAPLSTYTISIKTPAPTLSITLPNQAWSIAVTTKEAVAASLAQILGAGTIQASASSVAYNNHDPHFRFALYSGGCVTTGNSIEVVSGDVFIDQCGLQPASAGAAGFCADSPTGPPGSTVPLYGGNILFGPTAPLPNSVQTNQSVPTCTAAAAGQIIATGSSGTSIQAPPAYSAPPSPQGPGACIASATCSAAIPNHACTFSSGSASAPFTAPLSCYSPGSYSQVGSSGGIQNNLNPGVYYVTGPGDPSGCGNPPACPAVIFSGNTLNANFPDVVNRCWSAANNPRTNTWTSTPPCPSGFISFDPTQPADPQCIPNSGIVAPTLSSSVAFTGGTGQIDPGTYLVRATATTGIGETTPGPEVTVVAAGGVGQKFYVTVVIAPVAGATGYNIYMSPAGGPQPPTSGAETFVASTAATTFTINALPPGSAARAPTANTTGNTPLLPDNPSFNLSGVTLPGGSLVPNQTYWVRVVNVNRYGESLSQEKSQKLGATDNAIVLTIPSATTGATGYNVYGPSTTQGGELSYSTSTPTISQPAVGALPPFNLLAVPSPGAGVVGWPELVNRTGCSGTGFFNIPNRPEENNGVTFVLYNHASLCLNSVNGNQCGGGVGSATPYVQFSPYSDTLRLNPYGAACDPSASDGVFPIFSLGQGLIEAQGLNSRLGMTGTVYAPGTSLNVTQNAALALFGQMIVHDVNVQTGNTTSPQIYYGGACMAAAPGIVTLVQ